KRQQTLAKNVIPIGRLVVVGWVERSEAQRARRPARIRHGVALLDVPEIHLGLGAMLGFAAARLSGSPPDPTYGHLPNPLLRTRHPEMFATIRFQ
ncbi:hypothetical protein NAV26_21920, partial [Pseudomonas stutzeri]|uniref:hypothetical protein n=1 Tax=Stutzerimonas stutzeri TaxID=316 RepID=UPI00210A5EF1